MKISVPTIAPSHILLFCRPRAIYCKHEFISGFIYDFLLGLFFYVDCRGFCFFDSVTCRVML